MTERKLATIRKINDISNIEHADTFVYITLMVGKLWIK